MTKFKFSLVLLLSLICFSSFAGQDGNGQAFKDEDKDVAKVTCMLYAYNIKYVKSDKFTIYIKGKTKTFSTNELDEVCCERSEKLCKMIEEGHRESSRD